MVLPDRLEVNPIHSPSGDHCGLLQELPAEGALNNTGTAVAGIDMGKVFALVRGHHRPGHGEDHLASIGRKVDIAYHPDLNQLVERGSCGHSAHLDRG